MIKQLYFPQLDSIRGLSFIMIFLYHSLQVGSADNNSGTNILAYIYTLLPLAIDVFFILSAFLLTWIGLNEYERKKTFSYRNFFIRRALRIWPLYYIIMMSSFILLPYVAGKMNIPVSLPEPIWYLLFISNFYYIDHVYFLKFLWTLSVEEQFYLILGICLKFLARHLATILIVLLLISTVFSTMALVCSLPYYTNTLTYFFDFAMGGLGAIAMFKKSIIADWLGRLSICHTVLFYCYFPLHFILLYIARLNLVEGNYDGLYLISRFFFIAYVSLFIIEQISNDTRTSFFENNGFLIFTGKISYGLYCFHGITLTLFPLIFPSIDHISQWMRIGILFLVNYCVAVSSFYFMERPFLRLKKKFR